MAARSAGAKIVGIACAALLATPSATAAPRPSSALEQALMAISAAERTREPTAALAAAAAARQARNQLQNNALGRSLAYPGRSWPAAGRIVSSTERPGVDIRTAPGALILAPAFGRVSFAGAVEGHDQVLILDQGDGYASVLAGLGEVYVGRGDRVLRGEPLGRSNAAARKGGGAVRGVYFEVRAQGAPVDPRRWLSGEKPPSAKAVAAVPATAAPQSRLKVANESTAASPRRVGETGSRSAAPRSAPARET
jgi:septal ring factor EnvC (AmiA/AmiB activator)